MMTPEERRIAKKVLGEFSGDLRSRIGKRMKPQGYSPDLEGTQGSNPDSPDDPGDADDVTDKEFGGSPSGMPKEAMSGEGDEAPSEENEVGDAPQEEDDEELMRKLKEYRSSLGK